MHFNSLPSIFKTKIDQGILQLATGGGKDSDGDIHVLGYIFLACAIALAVWGAGLWVGLGDVCRMTLETKYGPLMLLFKVCVFLVVLQACLIVCMILFGAVFMGWMAVTWASAEEARRVISGGEAGYQEVEESARERASES